MNDGKVTLNRPLVGVIALVCLGMYAGLLLGGSDDADNAPMGGGAGAALFRVGILMSALWLALPGKGKDAPWATVSSNTFLGLFCAVLFIAWKPKIAIPLLLFIGILALIIKPRTKFRPPRNGG